MSFLFEQLPLAVQLRDDATFENYYAGDNPQLLDALRRQCDDGERYIYVYGLPGSGRSHLLQAACHSCDTQGLTATYLPLKELQDFSPVDLFDGLEQLSLVCIDDIDTVIGKPIWDEALFHLFNRLAQQGVKLLVAANAPVRELSVALPDLTSRLSWGVLYHIQPLTDEQRLQALQFRARRRGLELNDEVAQFIYHRCQRDTDSLLDVLNQLDQHSLKEQRRITIPFVKTVMAW